MTDNRGPLGEVGCVLPDYVTNVNTAWTPNYFDINKVSHNVDLSNKLTHALDNTTFALPNKGDFLKNISAYDPALSPDYNVPTITITAVPVQPDVEVCLYPEDLDITATDVISAFCAEEAEEVQVKVENIPCTQCDVSSPPEGLTSPSEQDWAPSTDSDIDNNKVPVTEPIHNDLNLNTTSPPGEHPPAEAVVPNERPFFQNRPTSVYDPRRQRRTRYTHPLALR